MTGAFLFCLEYYNEDYQNVRYEFSRPGNQRRYQPFTTHP